jgi:hypothetical protein
MTDRAHLRRQTILALAIAGVAANPARALFINPTFTSNVTSLSYGSQVESAFNYAAQQFESMYANPITINITVNTETTGLGNSNYPLDASYSYSTIRNALISNQTTSDQGTNIAYNWPTTDPTGTNTTWDINNGQEKALGLLAANNSASDGTFLFNSNFSYTFDPYNRAVNNETDFIGVAEHEISEIMGRIQDFGKYVVQGKATNTPFDLTHYSAPGVRDLTGAKAGDYFSIDAGSTNLKSFNSNTGGDFTDWLSPPGNPPPPYVPDAFNAFSAGNITNSLSPVDAEVMDILGYNRAGWALTFNGGFNDFLAGFNWTSSTYSGLNPFHGASMLINSPGATAYHQFTPGENFVLASNSDMGQGIEVKTGYLELNDSGGVIGSGMGLLVNQDGAFIVDGSGTVFSQGPISIGDAAGVTNAIAEFSGNATVSISNPAQTVDFYVGMNGTGAVVQTNNAYVQTPDLYVGYNTGSSGNYLLNGTATVSVSGTEIIGDNGAAGIFQLINGTNSVTGTLIVGSTNTSNVAYDMSGGSLNAGFVHIVAGTFAQSGGTITTPTVLMGLAATFDQSNGSLFANIVSDGVYNFSGGLIVGNFQNGNDYTFAKFTYSGGNFLGNFTNLATMNLNASFTIPYSMSNQAPVTIPSGISLIVNGSGINNQSSLTLTNGTLAGTGTKTNNGSIFGNGTISGSGELINNGFITEAFGSLVMAMSGNPYYNYNTITLQSGNGELDLSTPNSPTSDRLINAGTLTLSGSVVDGSGGFENASGGTVVGPGRFNNLYFVNDSGGTVSVPAGTLNIVPSFSNAGAITLTDPAANLTGGAIANTGIIQGIGTVASAITNSGTIQAGTGTLTLSGAITNSSAGAISVPTGGTVLVASGLASNGGTINLAGGTFDNNGNAITNFNQITGFGTFNAGALNNNGHNGARVIALGGGASTINAPVQNVGTISVTNGSVLFTSSINSGGGTIQPTNSTVTVAGALVCNTYTSTNSVNTFQSDVTITGSTLATMTGGNNDQFLMSGGTFTNYQTFSNTGLLQSSDPIVNNGNFTQTGSINQSADFTNTATATIGGSQTWAAGTNFNNTSGTATFQTDAGSPTAATLNVNITGGTVALASPQHWAGVTISGSGTLDVANNHVIINYGTGPDPIVSIAAYLASGYAGGAWNGTGIISTTAQTNSSYGLGYADSADPGNPANLPSGTIEIAYTLLGDADLNGIVNGIDFGILAANFNKAVTSWDQGDFNYDNIVNGIDFGELAANFNKGASGAQVGGPALGDPALVAFAQANGLMADVPEPASAGLVAIGVTSLFARRRRPSAPAGRCKF